MVEENGNPDGGAIMLDFLRGKGKITPREPKERIQVMLRWLGKLSSELDDSSKPDADLAADACFGICGEAFDLYRELADSGQASLKPSFNREP